MELVADTNIVIAAVLRPGMTRNLIFYPGFRLYSPKLLVDELKSHQEELIRKSQLGEEAYLGIVRAVLSNISITLWDDYLEFEEEAIAVSPDHDDWPFFAVALQRNCAIWGNEKRLKNQKRVKVYNTKELLELLQSR